MIAKSGCPHFERKRFNKVDAPTHFYIISTFLHHHKPSFIEIQPSICLYLDHQLKKRRRRRITNRSKCSSFGISDCISWSQQIYASSWLTGPAQFKFLLTPYCLLAYSIAANSVLELVFTSKSELTNIFYSSYDVAITAI